MELHRKLKKELPSVCLEIGGADGPMTPMLEGMFDISFTTDYSMNFLKRIEEKTDRVICLHADAHFLPLQDRSVDVVVCAEVLEHMSVPTQLLTEIQRITKPDGFVLLSVPNESSLLSLGNMNRSLPARDTHINFFTPDTLQKLLFRTGLEVIECTTLMPPAGTIRKLLGNLLNFIRHGFRGQHIQCIARPMINPWLFWESFQRTINRD